MSLESRAAADGRQVCTFFVDGLLFGVDVRQVQEVIRSQEMTPVPLASPEIRGLINLRGHIVSALDLRRKLDLAERDPELRPMNVVVRTPNGVISLLVDEIGDVLDVDESLREAPPATLPRVLRDYITDVYKLEENLLLLLQADLVTRCEVR